jgi:histone H3/H4
MTNLLHEPHEESNLKQIIDIAEQELDSVDPTPFSLKAFRLLKEKISEYTVQLIAESTKVARRHRSEQVSVSDVEYAAEYLVASTSRKVYKHMGTVGGILLGSAGSNMLAMITTHQYTLVGIIVTFVLTLIGTFLVAAHIVKE